MKELLEFIAKSLVSDINAVSVNETGNDENGVMIIELCVAPEDMGKVIGRQGRIAKAIRTVIKAAALNENKKVRVEILQKEDGIH